MFFKFYLQKTFTFFTKLSKSVLGVIIVPFLVAGVSFLSRQYSEDKGAPAFTDKAGLELAQVPRVPGTR